jgi:hypothetical protein
MLGHELAQYNYGHFSQETGHACNTMATSNETLAYQQPNSVYSSMERKLYCQIPLTHEGSR